MVLQNLIFDPWTRLDQPLASPRLGALRLVRGGPDDEDMGQKLESVLSELRSALLEDRSVLQGIAQIAMDARRDPVLSGVAEASDDLLLDRMYQMGLLAEAAVERGNASQIVMSMLQQLRQEHGVWNSDADSAARELQHIHDDARATELALRIWIEQICKEYERRHPDAAILPVEPIDLGPTNSARLPSIL